MPIDYFHINDNSLKNQTFYFAGTNGWQTWIKPPNCKFVNFFLVGGGAGGQGGAIGSTLNRNGGAGGGSAAYTYMTVPAYSVPDRLYILVASGGTGGASGGVQGSVGGLSYVCSIPDSSSFFNILLKSGTAGAGTSTSATAGTSITAADILFGELGLVSGYAGQAGGAGGVTSSPAATVTPTRIPFTGGAGGAGSIGGSAATGVSGKIDGILDFPTVSGGTNTAVAGATAGAGSGGYSTRENFIGPNFKTPMFFTGGAGGGAASATTGVGGAGGNGSFGCGGGGGGVGGNTTAGAGGRGGDGFVVITVS